MSSPEVYVTNMGTNSVAKISGILPATALPFTGLESLPYGVALDGAGNVYASDSGNAAVFKLAGGLQTTLPLSGLGYPVGLAFDAVGNLYVADNAKNAVYKLTAGLVQSTLAFTGLNGPCGVAVDAAGNVYVTTLNTPAVYMLTPGGVQSTLAFTGLVTPYSVALDTAGNVYVGDGGTHTVQKLAAGVQSTLGFSGLSTAYGPYGIAVDAGGNVYAVDSGNNRLLMLTPAGVQSTVGVTALSNPFGVALYTPPPPPALDDYPALVAFGNDVITFGRYAAPAPGTAFPDDLGTFSPLPQVAGSPTNVPGCRHRPFRSATRGGAGAAEAQYPEPGVGVGINWWQSTCPAHPAAMAARASDTITCNGVTYRIINDARPFEDASGNTVKVTFLSEVEEAIA